MFSGLQACLDWLESLPTWNMVSVPRGTIGLNQSQISEVQSAVTNKVHMHTLIKLPNGSYFQVIKQVFYCVYATGIFRQIISQTNVSTCELSTFMCYEVASSPGSTLSGVF